MAFKSMYAIWVYYEKENSYSNAKLKSVAKKFQVPQKVLSVTSKFNDYVGFTIFTNKFRVYEIINCFEVTNYSALKIEAIVTQCGCGSRLSFYTVFEEFRGVSPGFYRLGISKSYPIIIFVENK